jgi:hypothetical protein
VVVAAVAVAVVVAVAVAVAVLVVSVQQKSETTATYRGHGQVGLAPIKNRELLWCARFLRGCELGTRQWHR